MLIDRQSAGKIKSFAYITGVYLGDGSIVRNKSSYSTSFRLNTIDYDFAVATNEALYEILGRKAKHIYTYSVKKSSKPNHSLALGCKELCDFLELETDKKNKIPDYVYEYDREMMLEFVAGLLDSEGSVSVDKRNQRTIRIRFKNTSEWSKKFNSILQSLGVKTKITLCPPYKPWYKPAYDINLNTKSFIKNNLYFKIKRKQERLETLRDYTLSSGN